jgi:hypothetical protein
MVFMVLLLEAVAILKNCGQNKHTFMTNWIVLEAYMFLANIFGVSAYLCLKKIINDNLPDENIEISQ